MHVHSDGNVWVFHRCFNTVRPGIATCLGRGEANPPILQFDPSGKLLKSLGSGMFVNPHRFTVDGEGNLWVSDVNGKETVLGMSARNAAGAVLGQEVLKLDQNGKVLMMLGKMGVGSDPQGRAFTDGLDHTCGNWTSDGLQLPQANPNFPAERARHARPLGPQRRRQRLMWNAAHMSQGCSKPALNATGSVGRIYCFAIN